MYVVNKFVGWMISPVGLALVGLLVAYVCRLYQCRKVGRRLFVLSLVWLWVWATPTTSRIVGASLEREFLVDGKVPMVESFPEADAIVLLGGCMGAETNLSSYAEMWSGADRVWQAARLYKAGKAQKVIATGNGAVDTTLPLLLDFGVAKGDVSFMDAVNTEEEARSIGKMLVKSVGVEELGVEESDPIKHSSTARPKVLLVTSAWPMKRARLMFEKYASSVEVVCAPADFENSIVAARPFSFSDFLPDPGAFMGNSVALHEWVGIVGYKLFR